MPRVGPAIEDATQPSIAFADSVGLLVWRETGGHIRGCRITRDFEVLDTVMLDITGGVNDGESYHRFDVAASDHNFLVVWLEGGWYDVRGALISFDGTVTRRFTVDDNFELHDGTALDFDGENYLVAWWQQDQMSFSTRYTRVSTDGTVLDDPPWQLPDAGYQASVDVGFGDSLHLMTYATEIDTNTYGMYGRLVRRDGSLVDTEPFRICSGQTWTEGYVEFNGDVFTITLVRILGDSCELRVYPVSLDGVVLDTAGVLVERDLCMRTCALSWLGDTGLVAWEPGQDIDTITGIYARRLDRSFTVLDTNRLQVSSVYYGSRGHSPNGPAIGPGAAGFAVAYSYLLRPTGRNMVFRRVSLGGQVLDTVDCVASFAASQASAIRTASDGRDFFAVWQEAFPDSASSGVYGARFSPSGGILQPQSIRLSPTGCTGPSIAYAGGVYIVLWHNAADTDSNDLQFVRVSRDGTILDSIPTSIRDSKVYTATLAGGASVFLAVWQHGSDSIEGTRIAADGRVLDTLRLPFVKAIREQEVPVVAGDGDSVFLVVCRARVSTSEGVAVFRVGASGIVLDSSPVVLGEWNDYSAPCAAYGAGKFMVMDPGTGSGWLISSDGASIDTIADLPGWWSMRPRLVFDSANFLAYEARTADTIVGARVSPEGLVLDPYTVPLVGLNPDESYFAYQSLDAAADSLGVVGLTFVSFEPGPFMSDRPRAVAFRRITTDIGDTDRQLLGVRPAQSVIGRVLSAPDLGPNETCLLLDVCGRRVMSLVAGPNDISRLAPGVYFVRSASSDGRQAPSVRKVVIQH